MNGFRYGFSIGCVETPTAPLSKNLKSALKHKKVIENHIQKGLSLGRIVGPFSTPRYTPFVSFPFVVPQSKPGKFRIIHDLAYPKDNSVNINIPMENCSTIWYHWSDYTVSAKLWRKLLDGKKNTIEDAFRIIHVNSIRYHLLVFPWDNVFYSDICLPIKKITRHDTRHDLVAISLRGTQCFFSFGIAFKKFSYIAFFKSLHFFQLR